MKLLKSDSLEVRCPTARLLKLLRKSKKASKLFSDRSFKAELEKKATTGTCVCSLVGPLGHDLAAHIAKFLISPVENRVCCFCHGQVHDWSPEFRGFQCETRQECVLHMKCAIDWFTDEIRSHCGNGWTFDEIADKVSDEMDFRCRQCGAGLKEDEFEEPEA